MTPIHDCPACGIPTRRKTCCCQCLLHWSETPHCKCRKCVIVERLTRPNDQTVDATADAAGMVVID